ncbi:hypothetical protein ACHHYP_09118 [Achlya hypogyna]|uniref:Uncharacterized protein n=1 Tax=Achlya hypogyna TaxID=1202772 RepID=A0A1V9YNP6_ACHHY|nr:hypothetical protein ACHHYP_09118 [Achlya hypogyna]
MDEISLPIRSLWLQAHAPSPRDVSCAMHQLRRLYGKFMWQDIAQLAQWLRSNEAAIPRQCPSCDRKHCTATWTTANRLEAVIEYQQFLLSTAVRHVAVALKEDRAWTINVLATLSPLSTCIEVALLRMRVQATQKAHVKYVAEAEKPARLAHIWPHLVLACGGAACVARHEAYVCPRQDTGSRQKQLFVPKFSNVVDPFPEFTAQATPIVLSGFRVSFHPRMPRIVQTHKGSDSVLGYAYGCHDAAHLGLKALELQIALGRAQYSVLTSVDGAISSRPELIVWSCNPKDREYEATLSPHLPADFSGVPYLVEFRRGNVPILLSIPHGGGATAATLLGRWQMSHLTQRSPSKTSAKRFTIFADTRTVHVGADAAKAFHGLTGGGQPYMVIAKFHRKYVDVNRAAHEDAYVPDTALAERIHATYHSTLLHALQEIWLRFPMYDPLLLDIHGQRAATCPRLGISNVESKQLVYIGTHNGLTIHSMDSRRYFLGHLHQALLDKAWLGLYPPAEHDKDGRLGWEAERKEFLGGYIVRTYGHSATGANAIQLELGASMRGADAEIPAEESKHQRLRSAEALAMAMANHIEHIGLGWDMFGG